MIPCMYGYYLLIHCMVLYTRLLCNLIHWVGSLFTAVITYGEVLTSVTSTFCIFLFDDPLPDDISCTFLSSTCMRPAVWHCHVLWRGEGFVMHMSSYKKLNAFPSPLHSTWQGPLRRGHVHLLWWSIIIVLCQPDAMPWVDLIVREIISGHTHPLFDDNHQASWEKRGGERQCEYEGEHFFNVRGADSSSMRRIWTILDFDRHCSWRHGRFALSCIVEGRGGQASLPPSPLHGMWQGSLP